MDNASILVVGDVVLDDLVRTEQVAPAFPPLLRQTFRSERLAAAALVAEDVVQLGHEALLAGFVGSDVDGSRLRALAAASGAAVNLPLWARPTISRQRVTANGHPVATICKTDPYGVAPADEIIQGLRQASSDLQAKIKTIVIVDYGYGSVDARLCSQLLAYAAHLRIPCILDARVPPESLYGLQLLKTNLETASGLLAGVIHPGLAASADHATRCNVACQQLRDRFGIPLVIVTAGHYGCAYTNQENPQSVLAVDPAARPAEDLDCERFEDCVTSGLAVGLVEGLGFAGATQFAARVGFDAAKANRLETLDRTRITAGGPEPWRSKIVPLDRLPAVASRARSGSPGARLVLLEGGPALYAISHRQLEELRLAKRMGSTLVVVCVPDSELQGQPAIDQQTRAAHLAMQACVDVVIVADDDLRVARAARPDVVVASVGSKAAEYVAAHGGQVILRHQLLPAEPQHTATHDRQSPAETG